MAYVRRCTALMLLVLLITATLAMMAGPASSEESCVGMDLTVIVLGQPIPVLTNGCSFCFISQGPGYVGTQEFGIPETAVTNYTCLNP